MRKAAIAFILVIGIAIYLYLIPSKLSIEGAVEVELDSINTQRVNILYRLKEPAELYVKYWREDSKSEPQITPLYKSSNQFIPLTGLYSDEIYFFKLISVDGSESDVLSFSTKPGPKEMLRANWLSKQAAIPDGFILSQRSSIRRKNNYGYIYITDFNGETVWYQKVPGLPKLSWWTENNTVLVLSGNPNQERSAGDHIFEFDVYGNELIDLDLTQLSTPIEAHHEIRYAHDGSLLTLIYDRKIVDLTAQGGKPDQEIKGDAIVRLDKTGKILWKWSVFDVLDPLTSTYAFDSLGEWGHANTLSIDQDGNYLISFRDWNEIWKINSTNGALLWKLGEKGDFKISSEFNFSGQHAIHINPQGEYMMFDNGVKNKRSRILSFTLNEEAKTVDVKLNIRLPENLYSEKRGSAYFIDSERVLVCSPESRSIVIIDLQGNILARAHTGLPDYYRAVYVPQLYTTGLSK